MIESLTFSVMTPKTKVPMFVPCIGRFKHLINLNLSFSNIGDSCMLAVGTNCKHIR